MPIWCIWGYSSANDVYISFLKEFLLVGFLPTYCMMCKVLRFWSKMIFVWSNIWSYYYLLTCCSVSGILFKFDCDGFLPFCYYLPGCHNLMRLNATLKLKYFILCVYYNFHNTTSCTCSRIMHVWIFCVVKSAQPEVN